MGNGNFKREGNPEHRFTFTTRNPIVISICNALVQKRELSKTIEKFMEGGNTNWSWKLEIVKNVKGNYNLLSIQKLKDIIPSYIFVHIVKKVRR